jgi:hypothetical protein
MNETVNLILSAFHAKAEKLDVHLEIQADIPAVSACPTGISASSCPTRWKTRFGSVRRHVPAAGRSLSVPHQKRPTADRDHHPCEEEVSFQDDLPVSRQGDGIGVKSIQLAVTSLGGLVKFELNQRQFAVKLIL